RECKIQESRLNSNTLVSQPRAKDRKGAQKRPRLKAENRRTRATPASVLCECGFVEAEASGAAMCRPTLVRVSLSNEPESPQSPASGSAMADRLQDGVDLLVA